MIAHIVYCTQANVYGWDKVKRALLTYEGMYDDMLVPQSLVIERGDASWVSDLWDMKLGGAVDNSRNNDLYSELMEELIVMELHYHALSLALYHYGCLVDTTVAAYDRTRVVN